MWKTTGLAGLLFVPMMAAQAAVPGATTCGQQVTTLAGKMNITLDGTEPSAPDGPTNSQRLAQSDGVVTAPDTGSHDVIHPPPTGDAMATAPAVPPQSGSSTNPATSTTVKDGAARLRIHSLLSAAEAASRRGDEAQCQSSLADATKLAGTTP